MPRAKKPGGIVQGTPGKQYMNRSDLRSPGNETVKGQPYGRAAEQQAAQRAVPVTPPPGGATAPMASANAGPSTQPVANPLPSVGPARGMGPGEQGAFTRPTERPNEPVTAGLPVGPGPGPEVLGGVGAIANNMADTDSTAALITSLAARPGAGAVLRGLASQVTNGTVR